MRRFVCFALLLGSPAYAAEHDFPAPPRVQEAQRRASLSLANRAGLVEAPFVTTAFPKVSGFAMVLTANAAVQLSPLGWLHARLPLSYVRLDMPAGAQVGETAFGNLELGLEHGFPLSPSTRIGAVAAVVAPSAEQGSPASLVNNRALALGNALNGGIDAALLTPGVTGLRLGASAEHWLYPFRFRASLDLPLLVRLSRADLPEDAETHPLGLLPALDLRATWWVTPWFAACVGGALVTEPWRVQEPANERDRARRVQPVLEPAVQVQLGKHLTLGLDGSVPVGGNLGGEAWSVSTLARVGF